MDISLELLLVILFALTVLIISIVLVIIYNKWANNHKKQIEDQLLDYISRDFINYDLNKKKEGPHKLLKYKKLFIEKFIEYCQNITSKEVIKKAIDYFNYTKTTKKLRSQLMSLLPFRRIRAAVYLGYIDTIENVSALNKALIKEKKHLIKLYIVESLSRLNHKESIPYIIESLINSPQWYREKVNVFLSEFDTKFYNYLPQIINDPRDEIVELIIQFAEVFPADFLKKYLIEKALFTKKVIIPAFDKNHIFADTLDNDSNLYNTSSEIRNKAERLLKQVFTSEKYSELLKILLPDHDLQIPENLNDYLPTKTDIFIYNKFRLYSANHTNRYNLICFFSEEFLSPTEINQLKIIKQFIAHYYLHAKSHIFNEHIAMLAAKALLRNFPDELNHDFFIYHQNNTIRDIAIDALTKKGSKENIKKLYTHLFNDETRQKTIIAISEILRHNPEYTDLIVTDFNKETDLHKKIAFAQILSNRLEYFLHLLKFEQGIDKEKTIHLIETLISNGMTGNLITFLNLNNDLELETEILKIYRKILVSEKLIWSVYIKNSIEFLEKNIDYDLELNLFKEIENLTGITFTNKENLITYFSENLNTDTGHLIQSHVRKTMLKVEAGRYLKQELIDKLDIPVYKPVRPKREEKIEKDKLRMLKSIHILVYLIFPAFYTIWHFDVVEITPFWEQALFYLIILVFPLMYSLQHIGLIRKIKYWEFIALTGVLFIFPIINYLKSKNWIQTSTFETQADLFILDFNFYLIFYSTLISLIYCALLFFSFIGLQKQVRYARIKKNTFLFKDKVLPTISIIAPAYAEEENIIESVNSQLNLRYPNYELIVVSDGSPDNTLKVLIDYFALEKVEKYIEEKIPTQPIRGIYKNERNYPKLTVIDKVNGGKADALNVGINVAQNEYFCGIDSDSLLEPDALIKLTSMMWNSEKESIAFGGNILPINNCKVDRGMLEIVEVPKEPLAAFQTIEYLRAFMAGRVGWAYINSLLIISGAFGLFKKDRVIQMGGYLTGKSIYKKDTVGEDMELVVRLNRFMLEKKLPYSIHYCYDANCWTEVPELLKMSQVTKRKWKEKLAIYLTEILYADGFITEKKLLIWQEKIISLIHTSDKMRILVNQRDRWHRGLIDILNFHKDMLFNTKYKQIGFISLPYFFIFEMVGPLIEFQGYVMVVFAFFLGLINTKIALMLFIASIMFGIIISLSSLMISEKETNLFSRKEIGRLIFYAFIENFGPRQIANFWRIKGFFSSMQMPKGWGQMLRKAKPVFVLAVTDSTLNDNLVSMLEKIECKVVVSKNGNEALTNIKKENLKAAILDENLPIINAINIARDLKKYPAKRDIPIIVLSDNEEYMNETNSLLQELGMIPISTSDKTKTVDAIFTYIKMKLNT